MADSSSEGKLNVDKLWTFDQLTDHWVINIDGIVVCPVRALIIALNLELIKWHDNVSGVKLKSSPYKQVKFLYQMDLAYHYVPDVTKLDSIGELAVINPKDYNDYYLYNLPKDDSGSVDKVGVMLGGLIQGWIEPDRSDVVKRGADINDMFEAESFYNYLMNVLDIFQGCFSKYLGWTEKGIKCAPNRWRGVLQDYLPITGDMRNAYTIE